MYDSINAGWMDLGVTDTEHVAGTTSARDVFAAAQSAVKRKSGSLETAALTSTAEPDG